MYYYSDRVVQGHLSYILGAFNAAAAMCEKDQKRLRGIDTWRDARFAVKCCVKTRLDRVSLLEWHLHVGDCFTSSCLSFYQFSSALC